MDNLSQIKGFPKTAEEAVNGLGVILCINMDDDKVKRLTEILGSEWNVLFASKIKGNGAVEAEKAELLNQNIDILLNPKYPEGESGGIEVTYITLNHFKGSE